MSKEPRGSIFRQEPQEQLRMAIRAVIQFLVQSSARGLQEKHNTQSLGTAVNVQKYGFGNTGGCSGTGVAFQETLLLERKNFTVSFE